MSFDYAAFTLAHIGAGLTPRASRDRAFGRLKRGRSGAAPAAPAAARADLLSDRLTARRGLSQRSVMRKFAGLVPFVPSGMRNTVIVNPEHDDIKFEGVDRHVALRFARKLPAGIHRRGAYLTPVGVPVMEDLWGPITGADRDSREVSIPEVSLPFVGAPLARDEKKWRAVQSFGVAGDAGNA